MRRRTLGVAVGLIVLVVAVLLAASSARSPAQTSSSPASPSSAPPSAAQPSAAQPSAAPAEQLPPGYAGSETCKGCHEDSYVAFSHTKMGRLFLKQPRNQQERLGCENCHGPGKAHADQGGGKGKDAKLITFAKDDPTPLDQRQQVCLSCHSKGNRVFWKGSPHNSRDVSCTGCHVVMVEHSARAQLRKPTEIETCGTCHLQKRAQTMRSSHMPLREGKMTCSSCHDPHGTISQSLLREPSINDSCYSCHTEKRGPFLWEHAPVVESCVNCHDPHGSNHERMLKAPKPRLCQQCHVETRHPTRPYGRESGTNLKYVMGRSCANCHVNIHGSNHPSGFAFTR